MGSSTSRSSRGGFRIIRINKNGPAENIGLEVFFDFIVEVGGCDVTAVEASPDVLRNVIESSVDKPLKLVVYSARLRNFRDVYLTPSRWEGQGFMGAGVQFEVVENAMLEGLRVIEVSQDSPAATAGLIPYKDFLIATQDDLLRTMDDLINTVSANIDKGFSLLVFNTITEQIREVKIKGSSKYGGSSRLGFDVGTGYLHRLPLSRAAELDLNLNFSDKLASISTKERYQSLPPLATTTTQLASDQKVLSNGSNSKTISTLDANTEVVPSCSSELPVVNNAHSLVAPVDSLKQQNEDFARKDRSRTGFSSNSLLVTGGSTQASSFSDEGVTVIPSSSEPLKDSIPIKSQQIQENYNYTDSVPQPNINVTESQQPSLLASDDAARYGNPPMHSFIETRLHATPRPGVIFPIEAHHGTSTPLNVTSSKYQDN